MMKFLGGSLTAVLLYSASVVHAQDPAATTAPIPIEVFAARSAFNDADISPDGQKIVMRTRSGGKTYIGVLSADDRKLLARVIVPPEVEFEWLRWAGSDRVLISVSTVQPLFDEEVKVTRLLVLDSRDGSKFFLGSKDMGPEGDDVLWVAEDGSAALLSFQKSIYDWPGVVRFDLADPKDKGTQVQSPVTNMWEWYADDAGTVRMGTGWVNDKFKVMYRRAGSSKLETVARVDEDETEKLWTVARISPDSDEGYVVEEDENDRIVLSRYNLATRQRLEVVYRNADWDIETALLGKDGKPMAIEFTDDRSRRVWLDPELAKTQAKLEKALKMDSVEIASINADRSRMLVVGSHEADPGVVYIYDAAGKKLDQFGEYRPGLPVERLTRAKTVNFAARDGTKISGYLTLPSAVEGKNLPLIIMPHGGPYGVRDSLRYDDDVQVLASRGYAVLQPNYRGSGGYGAAFEKLGNGQIGRKMQDDLDDAMDWAVAQGIADKNRVCVVGASYGGYAAMWAVLRNPERYRCAASFAGVTDWKKILRYDNQFFRSGKWARKWRDRVAGGEDLDAYSPYRLIDKLERPLLVAQGKKDTVVPYSQYKILKSAAAKSGKQIEWLEFEEAAHGFDTAEDAAKWYETLLAFLAKHNPAK